MNTSTWSRLFLVLIGLVFVANFGYVQRSAIQEAVKASTNPDKLRSEFTNEAPPEEPKHKVAGLSCADYGGPADKQAAEMVYWQDIPSDAKFVSPYKYVGPKKKYLTFEPDEGGWNNIRMSMETAVTMAHAMGRTLVLPPAQGMYLLESNEKEQKHRFSFADFFHIDSVASEHRGVNVITFKQFLEKEIMTGNLRHPETKDFMFPPGNRTNWDGMSRQEAKELDTYLRGIGEAPIWFFDQCMMGFPADPRDKTGEARLLKMANVTKEVRFESRNEQFKFSTNPVAVDAPPLDRLRERLAHRKDLCVYRAKYHKMPIIHLMGDNESGARLLVHFYAFLFFEDWKQEQWTKRFVRDHLRYVDEIQCAAGRLLQAVRKVARKNGQKDGAFDTFHVRRGDFQYRDTRIPANDMYENIKDVLVKNSTIYIATDEKDRSFFDVFKKHHKVYFLDDFKGVLEGVNTNYYGMLDQLVASKGRTFVGCFYSTFTGYINRLRGYHSQKSKSPGYEKGLLNSYYYVPSHKKNALREYVPIEPPMWSREFPVAWRNIDKGVGELEDYALLHDLQKNQ